MAGTAEQSLGWIQATPGLAGAVQRARSYAAEQAHRHWTLEHLLLALTEETDVRAMLRANHVDIGALRNDAALFISQSDDSLPPGDRAQPVPAGDVRRIFEYASAAAEGSRQSAVTADIVMAAIIGEGKSPASLLLQQNGMTFEGMMAPATDPPASDARPAAGDPLANGTLVPARPPRDVAADHLASAHALLGAPEYGDGVAMAPLPREAIVRPPPPPALPGGSQPGIVPLPQVPRSAAPNSTIPPGVRPALPAPPTPPVARPVALASVEVHVGPRSAPAPQRIPPDGRPAATGHSGQPGQPAQPSQASQASLGRPPIDPRAGHPRAAGGPPPRAPPPQPQTQPAQPPTNVASALEESDDLANVLPRRMTVARPENVEIRLLRSDVEAVASTLEGHDVPDQRRASVARAICVRLRASGGRIVVEPKSPEIQWLDGEASHFDDDFVSWHWALQPQKPGTAQLQMVGTVRLIGSDGVGIEFALPNQAAKVRVTRNWRADVRHLGGLMLLFVVGYVAGLMAQPLFEAVFGVFDWTIFN